MGLLGDIYSASDSIKRRLKGLLSDPVGYVQLLDAQARDYNRNVEPVISGGLLQERPLSEKQLQDKYTNLAMLAPLGMMKVSPRSKGLPESGMGYKGVNEGKNYQLEHKPMTVAGGAAPLHDVESVFGPDIFSKNALQYFGGGDVYARQEKAVIDLMRKVKGNPNAMVTIYRGVPDGVNKINAGDWVTLDPKIAELYGRNVLKMDVPASHVTSWPDSLLEFGYYPK